MLDKTYEPAAVEGRTYEAWEASGVFGAQVGSNRVPFTVMMPPPNVTGSLHMGHALNMTLQDVTIRYRRMKGHDALWQPGTDHAGIATQMVVERQLAEQGKSRQDLGRAAFLDKVWEWKAYSGGTITGQLRRLGASADWPRERFTMDEGLNRAVRKVFVDLYRQGLIYKDKRLVNWDPKLHTAISDLEVEQREVQGSLWHFRYPVEGMEGRFITVATTRPETMLGDTAVAVHPDDPRYADLIGRHAVLPIVGRRIRIVADDYADPETGSGAVKITPAHDFNDFEVGRRHGLELINVFDRDARLNENAPEAYRGLDRYDARKTIVAEMEGLGLVETIEPHLHKVPHGDRSGVAIEPWLTDQWYCDAATLAKPAIAAVEEGRTVFVPKTWENTYFEWMRNIQPWCISRQLWWGHQIPAWYDGDGNVFVAETEAEAQALARAKHGTDVPLERDADVLDTWFSSALWPFSTLGWPDDLPEVKRYYPGDVLVTGFDIIFFWVARMMMMGLHVMGDVPFRKVYIHALVRDERGQKMSKSKGNVIDPLQLIDSYGADALRFTMAALAAQGRDVKLSAQRVEGYRNFVTKVWNAARFGQMNGCAPVAGFDPRSVRLTVDRWVIGELAECAQRTAQALEAFRFNDAAGALYQFLWGTFCDWYIEVSKPILQGEDEVAKAEVRATFAWVLDQALHLLHPLMPFVTEELHAQFRTDDRWLVSASWPSFGADMVDADAAAEMNWVVRIVSAVRTARAEVNVPPGAQIPLRLKDASPLVTQRLDRHRDLILRLARLSDAGALDGDVPQGSVQAVIEDATVVLPLAGIVDLDQERARLRKEIAKLDDEVAKIDRKLGNPDFLARAPEEVVDEQKARREEAEEALSRLKGALDRLG
ncbi:MAG: valine--tRNA ligase [Rhodospirillales bacterium]|jgi:valyl-tRNA synthetase